MKKKGAIPKDLTGKVFNRWTVLENAGKNKSGNSLWLCQCVCGNISKVIDSGLKFSKSKSCGCYAGEVAKEGNATHGYSRVGNHTPEYNAWSSMKNRCSNPKNNRYYRYGERGISVSSRWINSFENFILDMGDKPSALHSLERINNNNDYSKSNCIWGTDEQQRRNKSNNRWIQYNGESKILKDWCIKYSINQSVIYNKIKRGLSTDEIFSFYDKNKSHNENNVRFPVQKSPKRIL